ncbi:MAG: tetratricopeptide repeat protein [Candidatus Brocadiales bacterium]
MLFGILLALILTSCAKNEDVSYEIKDDIALYKRELRALPDDIDAHYGLGVNYYKARDYAGAVGELETVVGMNPNLPYAWNNLGLAYVGEGRLGKAITAYLKALQLERDFTPARVNLGLAYYLAGMFKEAGSHFEIVLNKHPDNVTAREGLGLSLLKQRRLYEAVTEFNKVLEIEPGNADAYKYIGIASEEMGDIRAAISAYRESLRLNPHDAETHWNLGNIYFDQDYLVGALREYTYAVDIKPDFKEAHFQRAITLKKLEAFREATAELEVLIELDPEYPEARYLLGTVYEARAASDSKKDASRHEEFIEEAISEYKVELENNPYDINTHKALGELYLDRGDHVNGLYHYTRVVEIMPASAEAVYELGDAYARSGGFSLALLQWERAAEMDPAMAIKVWKRVLEVRPSMAEAHYRLGMAYMREGKLAAAINSLNTAVGARPKNLAFRQALKRVRRSQEKALAKEGKKRIEEEWWP